MCSMFRIWMKEKTVKIPAEELFNFLPRSLIYSLLNRKMFKKKCFNTTMSIEIFKQFTLMLYHRSFYIPSCLLSIFFVEWKRRWGIGEDCSNNWLESGYFLRQSKTLWMEIIKKFTEAKATQQCKRVTTNLLGDSCSEKYYSWY